MLDLEELKEKLERNSGRPNVSTDELLEFVSTALRYENALIEIFQGGIDGDAEYLASVASDALGIEDCEECDFG